MVERLPPVPPLDAFEHACQHRSRAIAARGVLFKDLDATRSLQGLRLGQGGLILCGNTGVAYQGHENGPFAILCIINKRPFVNECK